MVFLILVIQYISLLSSFWGGGYIGVKQLLKNLAMNLKRYKKGYMEGLMTEREGVNDIIISQN